MFEKVNSSHPDKIADRIAGAIVDLAYKENENPHIAVEVLIGHGDCYVITESDVKLRYDDIRGAIERIADDVRLHLQKMEQDKHLNANQQGAIRCGDNGIFKGMPITREQRELTDYAKELYDKCPYDGKFVIDGSDVVICQSNCLDLKTLPKGKNITINPLGTWTGGIDVDSGATNRKLGSDMGDAITGGGLHGKDLSKADVTLNIYAHLLAQEECKPVELCCAIGDEYIDGKPYADIVEIARNYINEVGGFEKFAEWGLIR